MKYKSYFILRLTIDFISISDILLDCLIDNSTWHCACPILVMLVWGTSNMSILKISWMTYYKMDFKIRSQGQVHGWMIGRLYVTFVFEAYSFEMHLMSCKITMKFITVTSFSIFSNIFLFTIVVHFLLFHRSIWSE